MKKHIIGLTLFSLIVSAAAIVYTTLDFYDIPSVSVPESDSAFICNFFPNSSEEPAKIGKINADSPVIKQALYDKERKLLYLDLYNANGNRYNAKLPLKFSFFRKDAKEIKIVATEKYFLNAEYVRYNGTVVKETISVSYDWLENLNLNDNIYIIAESDSEYHNQRATSMFDSRFAKAITVFTNKKISLE